MPPPPWARGSSRLPTGRAPPRSSSPRWDRGSGPRGFPVDRILAASLIVHPQAAAYGFTWVHGQDEVEVVERPYEAFEQVRYPGNPIDRCDGQRQALHVSLSATSSDPAEAGLARDGYRDLVGIEVRFGGEFRGAVTFVTRSPDGFTDAQAAALHELRHVVSASLRPLLLARVQQTLLRTYLGFEAGTRVHRGEVRRGDRVVARSAIWFSDLRGFTRLAAELPQDALIDVLNQVFDRVVAEVHAQDGEVLKLMGDGALAIFRTADDSEEAARAACRRGHRAALATQAAIDALSTERRAAGASPVALGIGLHFGEVSYGNIGAETRLDFTVIGPAVNLAARIEGMCSSLGRAILMSDDVGTRIDREVVSQGIHTLKGVPAPVEIFAEP